MLAGHIKQFNLLKKKFELNQLAHAYVFFGEEKIGKKTLAIEFIKLINCLSDASAQLSADNKISKQKPCEVCRNCKDIQNNNFPDSLLVGVKPDKQEIEISQIREVINYLNYKSYYGRFKVVIIDDAEKMNSKAQSCLLKTLEEPKGRTILFLITSHPEMLLTTISSRCQEIKFCSVGPKEVKEYLVSMGAKEKIAHTLAFFCQRRPGRAVELFLDPLQFKKEQEGLLELVEIMNSDLSEKFKYAKKITSENSNFNLNKIIEILQRYFRHLLFILINADTLNSKGYFSEVENNYKNYSMLKLKDNLKLLQKINTQIFLTNASPKLALEILLMEI